jgi:hypothetical protein
MIFMPGDLISKGTAGGVVMGLKGKKWLKPGKSWFGEVYESNGVGDV